MTTIGAIFARIVSLLKAIPILDEWFQKLMVAYAQHARKTWDKDLLAALAAAVGGNQIDLEKQIGNPHAGEASGIPGTVIRPGLPK